MTWQEKLAELTGLATRCKAMYPDDIYSTVRADSFLECLKEIEPFLRKLQAKLDVYETAHNRLVPRESEPPHETF